jgi:(p)ppGpp synthase/HD superfamily hydrolase
LVPLHRPHHKTGQVIIAGLIDAKRDQREKFLARAIELLKKEFERVGLMADISGRPKQILKKPGSHLHIL